MSAPVKLARLPDWEPRLYRALAAARKRKFAWGRFDCALFACSLIEEMTGVDPAHDLRGRYSDKVSAALLLKSLGGSGLEEVVAMLAAEHGFEPISPRLAARGDIVLLTDGRSRAMMGIVVGARAAVAAPSGVAYLPTLSAIKAWRV